MNKLHRKIGSLLCAAALLSGVAVAPCVQASAEDFSYTAYKTPYAVETGIFSPPTVVLEVKSEQSLQALSAQKTPAVALLRADDAGNVLGSLGQAIATLDGAVRACGSTVIPAFRFETAAEMQAVYEYVNGKNLLDAMVFSTDGALVKAFKSLRANVQGGVIFPEADLSKKKDILKVRADVNGAFGMIAVVDARNAVKAGVEELQALGLTCWSLTQSDEYEIYRSLYTGINGMVVDDVSLPISVLERFREPTMIRKVFLCGHRGDLDYGDNVVIGARYAYYCGADYVELDLQRTKDNALVVMHDDTLNRTTTYTGNQTISQMTLEEVRKYKVRGTSQLEDIPVIEDYLDFLEKHPDIKLLVEFKTSDSLVPSLFHEKLQSYDVDDQIIVISAFYNSISSFRNLRPHVSSNFLGHYFTPDTMCGSLYVKNCSFGPGISYISNPAVYDAARVRGIPQYTWTFNNAATFEEYLSYNTSLTSDYCAYASDQAVALTTNNQTSYSVSEKTELAVTGKNTLRRRESPNASARVETDAALELRSGVGADDICSFDNGTLTLGASAGSGVYYFVSKWESAETDNFYYTMGEPFRVTSTARSPEDEKPSDKEEEKPAPAGCGSVVGVSSAAVTLGGSMAALILTKKKKTNREKR